MEMRGTVLLAGQAAGLLDVLLLRQHLEHLVKGMVAATT
jgi:hypothetical protein